MDMSWWTSHRHMLCYAEEYLHIKDEDKKLLRNEVKSLSSQPHSFKNIRIVNINLKYRDFLLDIYGMSYDVINIICNYVEIIYDVNVCCDISSCHYSFWHGLFSFKNRLSVRVIVMMENFECIIGLTQYKNYEEYYMFMDYVSTDLFRYMYLESDGLIVNTHEHTKYFVNHSDCDTPNLLRNYDILNFFNAFIRHYHKCDNFFNLDHKMNECVTSSEYKNVFEHVYQTSYNVFQVFDVEKLTDIIMIFKLIIDEVQIIMKSIHNNIILFKKLNDQFKKN